MKKQKQEQEQEQKNSELSELERQSMIAYIEYLVRGGLPDDMIQFFRDARYVPNKSQLAFHKATLECGPGKVQEILMEGNKGGGKLLKLDTPVPTPSGWTTMGELKVGDVVFSGDGIPCNVTWVSERQYDKTYDLIFSDGTVITAGASHEWVTETLKNRVQAHTLTDEFREKKQQKRRTTDKIGFSHAHLKKTPEPLGTYTTQEIVDTLRVGKMNAANHAITTTAVYYPEKDLPVPPYTLGAWLGDGSKDCGQFTSADPEILDNIKDDGYELKKYKAKYLYNIVGLLPDLREIGVLDNKHIPEDYLRSSYDQRLALLQGLMDTDGYADRRGHCAFTGTNKQLVDDVCLLMNSLGIKAVVSKTKATLNGAVISDCYDIHVVTEIPLFRLSRKLDRQKLAPGSLRNTRRYIVDAVEREPELMCCIMVDSPDHTYLVTDKFIRTHNSHAELIQAAYDCMKHPGLVCVFFRKQKSSAREHMMQLSTRTFKYIPHTLEKNQIIFPNGSKIVVAGFNTSGDILKYNGQNFSLFIYDELTMIKQDDYDTMWGNLRLEIDGYYPRMYGSTNPGGIGHVWVKKKFIEARREHREKDTRCIHSDTLDNAVLGENYKHDKLEKLSGQQRERWLLGNWDINEGAAFNFMRSRHVADSGGAFGYDYKGRHYIIGSDWMRVGGIDYGSAKPYCHLWLAINQNYGRVYVYREDYGARLSTKQQANRILQKTSEEEEILATFCDPAMARQYESDLSTNAIDEYAKYGVYLTAGSRQRVAGKMKIDNLLEDRPDGMPGLIIAPSCVNLIGQLDTLVRDPLNPEDVDTTEEDHAYDALRYGLSRFREPVTYEDQRAYMNEEEDEESHYSIMSKLFA